MAQRPITLLKAWPAMAPHDSPGSFLLNPLPGATFSLAFAVELGADSFQEASEEAGPGQDNQSDHPSGPGVALAAPGEDGKEPAPPPPPIRRAAPRKKLAAVTFDDGPYPGLTEQYLAALAAKEIRATFFMVGARARRYPGVVRQVANQGHEIANHSLRHADMTTWTKKEVLADLTEANAVLTKLAAKPPRLFRPPYGHWQGEVLRGAVAAGLETVTWSVDPRDWRNPSPHMIVARVLEDLHPGAIIILHEGNRNTARALPLLLDALQEKGYRLVTVSELLAAGAAVRASGPTP